MSINEGAGQGPVIALDGPAGSGKSTVAKRVAKSLRISYLDTGAMYRAATVRLLELGVDLHDLDKAAKAVATMQFQPAEDPDSGSIVVDGKEVKHLIRSEEISSVVSLVATNIQIRKVMVSIQKQIIAHARKQGLGIVAEGRDITTVVAPDADVRALITASADARLSRRAGELGKTASASEIKDQVLRRDRDDATVSEFIKPAAGVTLVDTTDMTIDQAVDTVLGLVKTAKA